MYGQETMTMGVVPKWQAWGSGQSDIEGDSNLGKPCDDVCDILPNPDQAWWWAWRGMGWWQWARQLMACGRGVDGQAGRRQTTFPTRHCRHLFPILPTSSGRKRHDMTRQRQTLLTNRGENRMGVVRGGCVCVLLMVAWLPGRGRTLMTTGGREQKGMEEGEACIYWRTMPETTIRSEHYCIIPFLFTPLTIVLLGR